MGPSRVGQAVVGVLESQEVATWCRHLQTQAIQMEGKPASFKQL